MTNPISINSLKKIIEKSPNRIALLCRTLPYTIEVEQARDEPNKKVIDGLIQKLLMVRSLARKNNIPTHGLIGWHILKVCYYKDTVRKQTEGYSPCQVQVK